MNDTGLSPQPETFDQLVRAAEEMLSEALSQPVRFTTVERLSEAGRRNLVLRCTGAPAGNHPFSFILKKVESDAYHPEDVDSWDTQRFFRDWVGAQFLSHIAGEANHAPHFYGGNRVAGFILLEDLGPHRSLVEPLLEGTSSSAEAALLRYSTRLGKLHADTAHHFFAFEKLYRAVNAAGKSLLPQKKELEESIFKVQASLKDLGILPEPALAQELEAIGEAVVHPGPFLAYLHGDPCPDNVFDNQEKLRLIDFEFSHFGHALIDATYRRMIFPTCWCANRLPAPIVTKMENRYRAELIQGCPEAAEDRRFEQALVTICGFWLLNTLTWQLDRALEADQDWGIASIRQRIRARLEAFITTSEEYSQLPALRTTANRSLEALSKRWSETLALPLYPAFQVP